MSEKQLWKVVGGRQGGGIVVRAGRELASEEQPQRLSKGAIVKQIELHDERLHYVKVEGEGPASGWVSLKMKNNTLLKKLAPAPAAVPDPVPLETQKSAAKPASRKMRILALHGQASNSKLLQFQSMQLKLLLGKEFEWVYIDGPMAWSPNLSHEDTLVQEVTEGEKRIASGKPLMMWYRHGWIGEYGRVEEAFECVKALLKEHEPVDVMLAFSQGSNLISMLQDSFRRAGSDVPWRLNVFFCGGQIDDQRWALAEPLTTPTVRVFNAAKDDFFPEGELSLKAMYSDLLELPQKDGHAFPSTQPEAGEIYARVAQEMRRHCGLLDET